MSMPMMVSSSCLSRPSQNNTGELLLLSIKSTLATRLSMPSKAQELLDTQLRIQSSKNCTLLGRPGPTETTQGAATQVTTTSCSFTRATTSGLEHMHTLAGADSLCPATSEKKCQRETTQYTLSTRVTDHKPLCYHSTSIGLIKKVLLVRKKFEQNEADSS